MKKIIVFLLMFITLSGVGMAQDAIDCITFIGNKDSRGEILKNIMFHYLRYKKGYREYTAWYLASFHTKEILTNPDKEGLYKVKKGSAFNILDAIKEKEFNMEEFFEENECLKEQLSLGSFKDKNIKTIITEKVRGLTAKQVTYTIYDSDINNDFLKKEGKHVEDWIENIAFSIFTDISMGDIIVGDHNTKIADTTIKNYFVKAFKPDELTRVKQIFTEKNLQLSAGSLSNPGDDCYDMAASANSNHKEAFLSKTDYFFLIKISNLRLDYKPDGDSENKWQISSVTINIELPNLFSDKAGSMANFSINLSDIRSTTTGDDSYRELSDILSRYIYAMIITEYMEIGSDEKDNNFFQQLYTQLNNVFHPTSTQGFEYKILIQKKDIENINEEKIQSLVNDMKVNNTFAVVEVREYTNNDIDYIQVSLSNCYFPISDFENDFKRKLQEKMNTRFKNCGNSPHQMLILIPQVGGETPCWIFTNEKTVEFNLKKCDCTKLTTDSIEVSCEDENWNEYTTKTRVIDENTIQVAILKDGKIIPYEENTEYIFKFKQNNNECTVRNVRR